MRVDIRYLFTITRLTLSEGVSGEGGGPLRGTVARLLTTLMESAATVSAFMAATLARRARERRMFWSFEARLRGAAEEGGP